MIGHALAAYALDRLQGALGISGLKRRTLIVPEVNFRKVTLQVLTADVMIDARDTTLEDAEVRRSTDNTDSSASGSLQSARGLRPGW